MKFNVKVEGMEKILTRLKLLERAEKKEVQAQCLEKAGKIAVEGLKDSAPKDTGALSGTVQVVERSGSSISIGYRGNGAEGRPSEIYGWYEHFGSIHNMSTMWVSVGYQNCKDEIIQTIANTLRELIGG